MSPGCAGMGGGAYTIILFVEAGVRAARGSAQGVAFESYSAGFLLTSGLSRISGFTMRVCSGVVLRSPMTRSVSALRMSCAGGSGVPPPGGSGTGRCMSCAGRAWVVWWPCSTTGAWAGGDLARGGGAVRVLARVRPAKLVVLVTINVARDTLSDCHFSAWSRPKPAPDPLPGPSVASGVIPTKGGRNGVLQPPPGRAPEGRWRSSPWKRCNHAPPRSRVREHPAPLGALRLPQGGPAASSYDGQGAPRTARCIKTGYPSDIPLSF